MPWKGKPFGWGLPSPYLGFLPEAQDATINALRQIDELLEAGEELEGPVNLAINYIEPPSVELAAKLLFDAHGSDAEIKRKAGKIPKPDPRKSKAHFNLWKYRFKQAYVAVPRPHENYLSVCAQLATCPYDYEKNWSFAGQLAKSLGRQHAQALLSVMVHPPPVPAEPTQPRMAPWTWLQRIQLAAAQMVANIEMRLRVPILSSELLEVTNGPVDWTIDAAVIALTQRARMEPEHSEQLCSHFFDVIDRLPHDGYWSTTETCFENVLLLPGLPEGVVDQVQQTLAMIQSEN